MNRQAVCLALAIALFVPAPALAARQTADFHPLLQTGFKALYGLDFATCERAFAEYERLEPSDPFAYASQSACVLFTELHRAGVLDAELYVDDKKLFGDQKRTPDPKVRQRLASLVERTKEVAGTALRQNPRHERALFARALANGLMADYLALLEGRFLAASKWGKAGLEDANRLLAVNPAFHDAQLWPGVTNYLVGSLSFPLRWLARLRGYPGNKELGINLLGVTAARGTLLKPYAKLLLVVTHLRARNRPAAHGLLVELSAEFPSNAIFAKHVKRLASAK